MKTTTFLPVLIALLVSLSRPSAAATTAAGPAGGAPQTTGVEPRHQPEQMLQKVLARLATEHEQRVAERTAKYDARKAELTARLAKATRLTDAEKTKIIAGMEQLHQQNVAFATASYQKAVAFVTQLFSGDHQTREQRHTALEAFRTQQRAALEAHEAEMKTAREALMRQLRDEVKQDHTPPTGGTGAAKPPVGTAA